jgi:hypothetical protein
LETAGRIQSVAHAESHSRRGAGDPEERLADDRGLPKDGEAQIAEIVDGDRLLIVRRTRLLGVHAELRPDWRHF